MFFLSEYDNWEKRYPLKKSRKVPWNGQWEITFDIENPIYGARFELKKGTYHYKLIVDGYYVYDKNSKEIVTNKYGEKISAFTLEQDFYSSVKSPIKVPKSKGLYKFFYWNIEAKSVHIAGSFNNYIPYNHPLIKKKKGYWEIELELLPGACYYQFIVDGDWIKDPMNPEYETGIQPEPSSIYSRIVVKD